MLFLLMLALIPAIALMVFVYRHDRVESEPVSLILKTFILGAVSIIPAVIIELILGVILSIAMSEDSLIYILVDNILAVALVEEYVKYKAAKIAVWRRPEFNFRFDAIIYCVASALGFAALENIMYVFENGLGVALMRAVLSVPLHAIAGITMGYFFGLTKTAELDGDFKRMRRCRKLALIVPTILHGLYDAALSLQNSYVMLFFFIFVLVIDIWAFIFVKEQSHLDRPL